MRKPQRSPTMMAALAIFLIFAVGILAVLLGGSRVYRRIIQRDQQSYNSRTATAYLATRIRQAPSPDSISILSFDGKSALAITETIEGDTYATLVYCYDGWLMELFAVAGGDFSPEDGEQILPAQGLDFSLENGLLNAAITLEDGSQRSLCLHIPGYEEVLP